MQELEQWQSIFMDFYTKKYSGRRLVWHHCLGSCVLRAHFPKGSKELSVSLFQAVVLMLFNDAETLSFQVRATQAGNLDLVSPAGRERAHAGSLRRGFVEGG